MAKEKGSNRGQAFAVTRPASGRIARDTMFGLMKTCRKLGISFFTYLGDRLGLNDDGFNIPPLAEIVAGAGR